MEEKVFFLPAKIPEELIWSETHAIQQIVLIKGIHEQQAQAMLLQLNTTDDYKERFSRLAKLIYGQADASSIMSLHTMFAARFANSSTNEVTQINEFLSHVSS